jgi:hypothetical protein
MTDYFRLLASDFRVRAEDIFARAERVRDADIREKMRGIAVGYEKMAQRVEQHARDVDAVYRGSYAAQCRRRAVNPIPGWLGTWRHFRRFVAVARDVPWIRRVNPVPRATETGARVSILAPSRRSLRIPYATPFGFLTGGAVGVSPSRPEAASAVRTWRQPLHARRAPRRPSSPPSNPRRAPGYGWIAKAIGIGRASVDHVLQAAR